MSSSSNAGHGRRYYNEVVLARILTFSSDCDDKFFEDVPAAPSVFLLRGDGEPYVSKTGNLRRRLRRLLGKPAEHTKRLNLRERVREVEFTLTGSDFESQFLLYQLLREAFPKTYAARLRLRPAPLVKLHLENEYPRASVTTRLGRIVQKDLGETGVSPVHADADSTGEGTHAYTHREGNLYYGPFPSRAAAKKFASDALDFFKMRRCVDDLHPDPSFPGCVYSEMKMCLAPCYKGCTDDEYHAEVGRVQTFFDSGGESLSREFAEQRERASAQLGFEEAATIHAKLEKLKHLLSQLPEIVQPIDRLAAIMVQPSAEAGSVSLFCFSNGVLRGPLLFEVDRSLLTQTNATSRPAGQPAAVSTLGPHSSMESRMQELIQNISGVQAKSTVERTEHLAILKRWYYRSHRVGEIFFADEKGMWPWRRIVRGIGRVHKGEKAEESITFSAMPSAEPPS
jgi:excinuclease ABC subunit C